MSETIFKKVDYPLSALVSDIHLGRVGLPDIQRPFVWKNTSVRDLFDSMYRGYPVGYLLFWENAPSQQAKGIGTDSKQLTPSLLIVDGQQRLTALYAVTKGIPVVRENYEREKIVIAFDPLQGRFEVADAATERDRAFIPDISVLWQGAGQLFDVVEKYLRRNEEVGRTFSPDEKRKAQEAITRLSNLTGYPFTALQLSPQVNEEQVSEVFVRINSKGKPLNQSDFILTLMSVFWDEGRAQLEMFCRNSRAPSTSGPSPFNPFIEPQPDQLLRTCVNLGFKRGRLSHVYNILRGKDLETQEFSAERRVAQFEILKKAQARALNLQYWHDFLKCLVAAGYRHRNMISSQTAIVFSYSLYLIGRTELNVPEPDLRIAIARWFFMSSLTGRYSSSPESAMEFDLARLREVTDASEFISTLDAVSDSLLTQDYWLMTLPNELATSAARSPSLFAYFASLVLLDARALYSSQKVSELLDPAVRSNRAAVERHHLFPKEHLKNAGITDNRDLNQNANFTFVEWGENASISDQAPAEYVAKLSARFSKAELKSMLHWHALPPGWETMPYKDFLLKRRELMAKIVKEGYSKIRSDNKQVSAQLRPLAIEAIISEGERSAVEFKSTLRVNLHTDQVDQNMELGVLKTLAGFLNLNGGTLVIGVADDKSLVGIEADRFPSEDKMSLHLINLIRDRIGAEHMHFIHPRFEDYEVGRVMVIECEQSNAPVYVKDKGAATERFFIRTGTSTTELTASQMNEFIKKRF